MALMIKLDRDLCESAESCDRVAPETFEADEEGKVTTRAETRDDEEKI